MLLVCSTLFLSTWRHHSGAIGAAHVGHHRRLHFLFYSICYILVCARSRVNVTRLYTQSQFTHYLVESNQVNRIHESVSQSLCVFFSRLPSIRCGLRCTFDRMRRTAASIFPRREEPDEKNEMRDCRERTQDHPIFPRLPPAPGAPRPNHCAASPPISPPPICTVTMSPPSAVTWASTIPWTCLRCPPCVPSKGPLEEMGGCSCTAKNEGAGAVCNDEVHRWDEVVGPSPEH